MVFAFAGDSTMTSVLDPAGAPGSGSYTSTADALGARPRLATAFVVAFVFAAFFAEPRAFVAAFFVAMLSVPSGVGRLRFVRRSLPPREENAGRPARCGHRFAKAHVR